MYLNITKAQNAAGRNFPSMLEIRSAVDVCHGGSDAKPTWKKSPVNMLKKKSPGDVVNRDRIIVNVRDTKSNAQRASLASQLVPE